MDPQLVLRFAAWSFCTADLWSLTDVETGGDTQQTCGGVYSLLGSSAAIAVRPQLLCDLNRYIYIYIYIKKIYSLKSHKGMSLHSLLNVWWGERLPPILEIMMLYKKLKSNEVVKEYVFVWRLLVFCKDNVESFTASQPFLEQALHFRKGEWWLEPFPDQTEWVTCLFSKLDKKRKRRD